MCSFEVSARWVASSPHLNSNVNPLSLWIGIVDSSGILITALLLWRFGSLDLNWTKFMVVTMKMEIGRYRSVLIERLMACYQLVDNSGKSSPTTVGLLLDAGAMKWRNPALKTITKQLNTVASSTANPHPPRHVTWNLEPTSSASRYSSLLTHTSHIEISTWHL